LHRGDRSTEESSSASTATAGGDGFGDGNGDDHDTARTDRGGADWQANAGCDSDDHGERTAWEHDDDAASKHDGAAPEHLSPAAGVGRHQVQLLAASGLAPARRAVEQCAWAWPAATRSAAA